MSLLHNVQANHSYEGGEGGSRSNLKFPLLLKCSSILIAKVLKGVEVIMSIFLKPGLLGLHWYKTDIESEIRNVKCYRNTQIHSWRVARALTGENQRQQQRRQVWFGSSPLQLQVVVGWHIIPQILITVSMNYCIIKIQREYILLAFTENFWCLARQMLIKP